MGIQQLTTEHTAEFLRNQYVLFSNCLQILKIIKIQQSEVRGRQGC